MSIKDYYYFLDGDSLSDHSSSSENESPNPIKAFSDADYSEICHSMYEEIEDYLEEYALKNVFLQKINFKELIYFLSKFNLRFFIDSYFEY